jgi:hypothetical protein
MDRRWIFAVILGTFPAAAASAQQSHLDTRRQIEQLAATFSERYNKQDAGALAKMFTKDAVRVTSGNNAPSVGPQAIEKIYKTQLESGFRHIDLAMIKFRHSERMLQSRLADMKLPVVGKTAR